MRDILNRVKGIKDSIYDTVTHLSSAPPADDIAKRFTGIDLVSTNNILVLVAYVQSICQDLFHKYGLHKINIVRIVE